MGSALALLAACGEPEVRRVTITTHYVPDCAPAEAEAPRQLELVALGDFDRSNDSVAIVESRASLQALALPAETLAAEISTLSDRSFWGGGELDARARIPLLLWRKNRACRLASELGPSAAEADERWLLGASSRLARVLALGPGADGSSISGAVVDLHDASSAAVASLGDAVGPPRSHSSLSELGTGFLIAGGVDPEGGQASSAAWHVDGTGSELVAGAVRLATPRARHAALSLPSGRTLLIGGESASGEPLASVEVISPDGRETPLLTLLETPRLDPKALLLDDRRVLVGGGFTWTGPERTARRAIGSVEFLSTDLAQASDPPVALEPAALDRAFTALAAGAALAVGGCGEPVPGDACIPCEGGGGCVSRAVWWLDPRGEAHALSPLPAALAAARPALVPGTDGSPWLIADGALGRFDPWRGLFVLAEIALPVGGVLVGSPQSLGRGAFVWLQREADTLALLGIYHSQRGRFTQDIAPLLIGGTQGVVPHRPPADAGSEGGALSYSPSGGLRLTGSAAAVSIADTEYADFTLELTLESGPPPLLRLAGGEAAASSGSTFGGLDCAWPDLDIRVDGAAGPATRLWVRRSGDRVQLAASSADVPRSAEPFEDACERALPERVALQIVGTPAGTTVISRIEIRRTLD